MLRYFFIVLFSLNILSSNENVVKTSELELFLFKIGFESLLKDVDVTKDKTSLNSQEIKKINEKVELIMAELYKDNRVLFNDTNEKANIQSVDKKELDQLKKEMAFLKKEILELKNKKEVRIKEKEVIKKKEIIKEPKPKIKQKDIIIKKVSENQNILKKRVATPFLAVYKSKNTDSEVIRKIKHNTIIDVEYCNAGWCKMSEENSFVREFLIKPWKM